MLGFTGLVLLFVNGFAISRHPEVKKFLDGLSKKAQIGVRSMVGKKDELVDKAEKVIGNATPAQSHAKTQ